MDNFQIETAQNVSIRQNVANIGDRVLAFGIDGLLLVAIEIVLALVVRAVNLDTSAEWVTFLIFGLPLFLYHLFWETFNNGQSLGKAAMKIRVVKLDGSKPAFSNYLVRWLLRFIDITITSGGVAIVSILLNGKGQRLGDLAAQTTVISERDASNLRQTLMVEVPKDYQPTYPQVTILSDKDVQTIKNVFDKAKREGKHKIILALATKLSKKLDVQPEEAPLQFIENIITDYNFYTQQ